MKETFYYGPVPGLEPCAQEGPDYEMRAEIECSAFKKQLTHVYQQRFGELPNGFEIKVVLSHSPHYGNYYEVCGFADSDDEEAMKAACWLDDNTPTEWDFVVVGYELVKKRACDF